MEIQEVDVLFLPINFDYHWHLVCIDYHDGLITYYNSLMYVRKAYATTEATDYLERQTKVNV